MSETNGSTNGSTPGLLPAEFAEALDDGDEGGLAGSVWPIVFGGLVLVAFVVALVVAQDYASRARLMPVFISVLGIALTGLFLVREGTAVAKGQRRAPAWNLRVAATGVAFGWLLLFVVLVFLLGFSVATLIYLPLFLIRVSRLSALRTAIYTLVAFAVLAVAYLYGNIDLPGGLLLPALPVLYG